MLEVIEHLPGSLIKLILLCKIAYSFLEFLHAFDLILEERKVNLFFFSTNKFLFIPCISQGKERRDKGQHVCSKTIVSGKGKEVRGIAKSTIK